LYPYPVDMRKSFYTLSGVVSSQMGRDVRGGEVFIFINRQQNIMKILHMEYAGLVIYHKKLDSGRFRLPQYDPTTGSITIKWPDLVLIVKSVKTRKPKLKTY
jgi:transposase